MKSLYIGHHQLQKKLAVPLFLTAIPAGFPSPVDDYMDKRLDLNEYLIKHEAATYYCRVSGDSMKGAGIFDGDLLIVDRAIKPRNGHIVVANVDGKLACKMLDTANKQLLSYNRHYAPIAIRDNTELVVEGVVIYSIRSHVCAG